MKNTQNTQGFSMIFAMGIVLTISLTVIYLLEYILPYAQDTKGIEFSSNAFYQSTSAVEDALFYVANNNLGDETNDNLDINSDRNTDFGYDIVARGDTIPPTGEGNSEYNPDWNRLSIGEPLQLEIGGNRWNNATLRVKVPNTGVGGTNTSLRSMTGGVIAWQLSSNETTLNSRNESDRIDHSMLKIDTLREFDINGKTGVTIEGGTGTFNNFYGSNCNGTNEECTLKVSVINDLILNDSYGSPIPYIEYQVIGADNIPLRYTRINTSGFSAGFKKDINIKIPQQTVNEAFDFTVFQ